MSDRRDRGDSNTYYSSNKRGGRGGGRFMGRGGGQGVRHERRNYNDNSNDHFSSFDANGRNEKVRPQPNRNMNQSTSNAHNEPNNRVRNDRRDNNVTSNNQKSNKIDNKYNESYNEFNKNFGNKPQTNVFNYYQTKDLLTKMLSSDYGGNIALDLLDPKIQIKNFLNNSNKHTEKEIRLLIEVTLKASENLLMEKNFREFLQYIIESNFSKKSLDQLISVEMPRNFDIGLLKLIILFFKLLFETIPGLAYDVLAPRVHNMLLLSDNLRNKQLINDDVLDNLKDLEYLKNNCSPYNNVGKKDIRKQSNIDQNIDPPDDYRKMNIFPSAEDLNMSTKDVFLRQNKEIGVYKSVDDYLDVQFRLMREDFIQPLREGITLLKHDHVKRRMDIRIYKRVFIINSLPAERIGIIFNLKFDISHFKRVKWIQSKRFLYGSLLCLSHDNFKTLLFAIVANRDIKDLEQGIISVKFCNCTPEKEKDYTIVETTNMFESYRHVLVKLQETNETNLCLQKFLVFADENINPPTYLSRNIGLQYEFMKFVFYPGNQSSTWPRAIDLELDESQFQAFKTALTKEIAIIQGPPGTGKTYLGLKICRCLLDNVHNRISGFGPILVVCYTNHALDQFLEGISTFNNRIIRIGNRSQSELLQNYSLLNWKKKEHSIETGHRRRTVLEKMRFLKGDILSIQARLNVSHESLLDVHNFKIYMSDEHFQHVEKIGIRNWLTGVISRMELSDKAVIMDNIIEWIMYEEMIKNVHEVIIDAQVDLMNYNDLDNFEADEDLEVNFINNHRRLDIDEEDIGDINQALQNEIGRLNSVRFDEDIMHMPDDGFTLVKSKLNKKLIVKKLRSTDRMTEEQMHNIRNLDRLNINDRWKAYRFWRSKYIDSLNEKSKSLETEYDNFSSQLNEINFEEDRKVMMKQSVIGMTTTGAARYGRVLAQIQCKIIIVEEAAEVLESHIIGSLNPGCEHLILIGDHKQLKPNPTVYELAKHYNLDLSLFERLINNNLHFNTLELQHRMRPEIAEIMKYIYENLKNHESVLKFPNVPAVSTNLYFFDHEQPESRNDEISSYSNEFEANFVVSFCRHLMKNGVENRSITVLTLYSGQLFLLRSKMPKPTFEGIRVCVVDNYQGEENEIIILSLVRSNSDDKIGFLSIENRICVCLSRAKFGLFVLGNFQILADNNRLWKDICLELRRKNLLGNTLTLLCQNHPEKRLEIQHFNDFSKYPEGGCEELCNQRLTCGHACRRGCHILDRNHQKVRCLEKCTKLCTNGHRCKLKCWETCSKCLVTIAKVIPGCEHVQELECYRNPEPNLCKNKCGRLLPCGHNCIRMCKDKCADCLEIVTKVSPECGHEADYQCSDRNFICKEKCRKILDCEHPCIGSCGRCNSGRLHENCSNKCKNQLICGHVCKAKCSFYCPPCNENCEEGCSHNVCPKKCGDECVPCNENCRWKCKHLKCTKKCYENCDRDICNESCLKMLDCIECKKRFQCYGICGEPCRKICMKCDPELKDIFFGTEDDEDAKFITLWTCGHSFECESMDKHMATAPTDSGEIVQKRCPKCNTVINKRSCFRYLNIVRKIYHDIKAVQKLISRNEQNTDFIKFIKELEKQSVKISEMFKNLETDNYFAKINRDSEPLSNYETSKYNRSLDLVSNIYSVLFVKYKSLDRILDVDYHYVAKCIRMLIDWLNPIKRKFSDFEIDQFNAEFDRINIFLKLTTSRKSQPFLKEVPDFIDQLKHCYSFSREFAKDFHENWKEYITNRGYLPNMGITETERVQIVKAIGLGKGRWYKCPNGHFYVIGECGGANQITKCAECQAMVGGESHRVLSNNSFAPEIDGAQYPAFSEQANLLNFEGFLDIFD